MQNKFFTYRMSEPEYFHYRQNWWISLIESGDTGGPLRHRSGFNQAVYTKPFTPRIWRTTTQAHALLKVPATAIVIEFFLHLEAMERILVIFLRIQRKSVKEDACTGLRSNGATRCLQIFGEKPHTNGFLTNLFFFLLQINRLQLTAVYCNRRGGGKDNTSNDPFSAI